jgi:hypothetical protein
MRVVSLGPVAEDIWRERRVFIFKDQGHFALRTSGNAHRTSQRRIPEELNPQQKRCENFKFRIVVLHSYRPMVQWTTLPVCWDSGFESLGVPGRLSLVSVVCCQIFSASGCSVIQRSPTECGGSERDRKASVMRPWPTRGCWVMLKKIK